MRLRGSLLLAAACLSLRAAGPPAFQVVGAEPGPWAEIFGAVGIRSGGASQQTGIFVLRGGEGTAGADWAARVSSGAYLILEGDSEAGRRFGFRPTARRVRAVSVEDLRYPRLEIVWERPVEVPVFDLPGEARVFARERWSGAPLVAGFRRGAGAVLWLALSPGTSRVRTVSLPAPCALRPGAVAALPVAAIVGLLRFILPSARRPGLSGGSLEAGGDLRAAHCGVALLRTGPPQGRLPAPLDRKLPSPRDSGVRLARTAARQREVLGGAPCLAREDRPARRRQPRLAEAHESPERRVLPGGRRGRAQPPGPVRLGRRQPGGTVLRVFAGAHESLAVYAHERGCAAGILEASGIRSAGAVQRVLRAALVAQRGRTAASSSTSGPSWRAGCRRSGWRNWNRCAVRNPIWIWC